MISRQGKGFNLPFFPNQPHGANAHPIREGDPLAIRLQLPPCCLVLNRTVIVLKLGIAFLSWLLLAAVFVEARNGEPRPICRCLASLLVEAGGKEVLLRKLGAIDLQVIVANGAPIHPQAQTRGTRMNCTVLIASSMACGTGLVDSQFVLADEHAHPVCGQRLEPEGSRTNIP